MYDKNKHAVFSARMANWFRQLQNLREEAARLDAIYVHETSSGGDAAFVTTENATKQEHIDGIVFMRAFVALIDGGSVSQVDRISNITPFLAGQ